VQLVFRSPGLLRSSRAEGGLMQSLEDDKSVVGEPVLVKEALSRIIREG
jgi:hypothetical protein